MTGVEDPGRRAGESSARGEQEDPPRPPSSGSALMPASDATLAGSQRISSTGPADPVSEEDLVEAEAELCADDFVDPRRQAMTENLMQRKYDHRLLQMLAADDFTGAKWEYFAIQLARYGIPVLMSWTRTGKIAKLCADRGRPIRPLPGDWTAEDRVGLTHLTIGKAINVFRDRVLRPAVWEPNRGATVKSFFMGSVIQQFPNHYNSWYDEGLRDLARPGWWALEDNPALATLKADQPWCDPARTVEARVYLTEVLEDMPEDLRVACLLLYRGYSVKEAAAAIGKTGDALSEQMRRYRQGRGRRMR